MRTSQQWKSVVLQTPDPTVPKGSDLPDSPLTLFPSPQKSETPVVLNGFHTTNVYLLSEHHSDSPVNMQHELDHLCSSALVDSEQFSGSFMGSRTEQDPNDSNSFVNPETTLLSLNSFRSGDYLEQSLTSKLFGTNLNLRLNTKTLWFCFLTSDSATHSKDRKVLSLFPPIPSSYCKYKVFIILMWIFLRRK